MLAAATHSAAPLPCSCIPVLVLWSINTCITLLPCDSTSMAPSLLASGALKSHPLAEFCLQQLTTFAAIIDILKEQITWHSSSSFTGPPLTLPDDVTGFCADALMVNTVMITQKIGPHYMTYYVSLQDDASGGNMEMGTPLCNGEQKKHRLKHSISVFCYSGACVISVTHLSA